MITKILFTVVIIIAVAIFYRQKADSAQANERANSRAGSPGDGTENALPTRTLAYALIGILIAISVAVFGWNWQQSNKIVNIRVTSDGGEVISYQARHSEIKGRSFTTLTGVDVTLGESDRVEMLQQ